MNNIHGQESTAWEDINPPMASARRQGPLSPSSVTDEARTTFRNELTACLALTAPAGMTEEARRDWLIAAWDTLKDIPTDILIVGTKKAREQCDHPSKIVPTIIAETAEMVRWRSESRPIKCTEPLRLAKPDYCTPEEASKILEQYGLKSNRIASR